MLIAVDTNVLMDLAAVDEPVWDAVKRRLPGSRLVVLPTVIQELTFIARHGEAPGDLRLAQRSLENLVGWDFEPVNFLPGESGLTERIAARLRVSGLLPETEVNDSFILAEASLLGCGLFVSSDGHMTALDFQQLTLELKSLGVSVPAIATPRDILRKFYS